MKHLVLLIFALLTSNSAIADKKLPKHIDPLNYLNRKEIVKQKISQVSTTISFYDHDNPNFDKSMSEEEIENLMTSCFKQLVRFDKNGNIVGHTIQRIGSWVVYQYDEHNNITRFGWQDKGDGTLERADSKPKELLDTQLQYEEKLSSKVKFLTPHESTIVDSCSNVDGVYLIYDGVIESGLPKQAKAKLLSNAKLMFEREEFQSPEMLYIYFEYSYGNYVDLDWGD